MKVLVVDDHEAIQQYIKEQILKILPHSEISLCGTIESAKHNFNEFHKIDFAICDIELKSGANLTIPQLCAERKIPYMVYSSHVNKVLISELQNINVSCYVSKTSGVESLRKGLESLIGGQSFNCYLVQSTMDSRAEVKETERLFLSNGQKTVLGVMAKGFNREEAAKILKLTKTTINNHIARARDLNECENFDELMRRYKFWDITE